MTDAISRCAVLPTLVNHNDGYLMYCDWHDSVKECQSAIDSIPSLDVVPVVHYKDTGSSVIKVENLDEWQGRIILDEGEETHNCTVYYQESEDYVPVVRCKDCIHAAPLEGYASRKFEIGLNCRACRGDSGYGIVGLSFVTPDGYCDDGLRRAGEAHD